MFYSPLRYPGGKNKLSGFVAKLCIDNKISNHYIEPYAGGASVALFLLFEGYVKKITINDKDFAIYAFWYSVINKAEELCDLIDSTEITVDEWRKQKEINRKKDKRKILELGFSTLFLNRTNRSGIIGGGMIGGVDQISEYKIDCRFNKEELKKRIREIASHKESIQIYNLDAIELIDIIEKEGINNGTIFYLDPPYYLKAESLYMNYYCDEQHLEVSKRLSRLKNVRWIVSYDDHDFINVLYQKFKSKRYTFNHSAYNSRSGKEVIFFSDLVTQPKVKDYNPIYFKVKKSSLQKEIVYLPKNV